MIDLNKPQIVSIIGDSNSGKSNLLYYLIDSLQKEYNFNLFSYGLRFDLNEKKIYSIQELEQIKDSIIILDEFVSLFDVEDRKKRKLIESTFRLLFHNNNILILSGNPENYKKFVSSKLNTIIFKKCTIVDMINGSRVKNICLNYKGYELGSSVLNLGNDECLMFDGNYRKEKIPYMEKFDSKKENKSILCKKCT